MTAVAAEMLVSQIMPIIIGSIAGGAVRPIRSEDLTELQQDALALAARILDSAEQNGKTVPAKSVAYYSLKAIRSGRRSTSASRTDVMNPATELDGRCSLVSIDAPVGDAAEDDGEMSLHDILTTTGETSDTIAARELDWAELDSDLPDRHRTVVQRTAEGFGPNEIADELQVSPPRVVQLKRRIGKRIRGAWGDNILADVTREPLWRRTVRRQ